MTIRESFAPLQKDKRLRLREEHHLLRSETRLVTAIHRMAPVATLKEKASVTFIRPKTWCGTGAKG
jgi:hypothetical protein